jgi:Cornichon protein
MSGEAWLYLLAVLINAVNLFLQVFFTIMYSDLEWCVHNLRQSLQRETISGLAGDRLSSKECPTQDIQC